MAGNVETEYVIRRKIFTLFGAKFHVFNQDGELIGFSKQKAFKLKEDIRFYADESMQQELVTIKARSIVDFSAAYDVTDAQTQEVVGALRRKGMKSIMRDEWHLLGPSDTSLGSIKEDSTSMALVRRYLPMGNLVPQKYHLGIGEKVYADYQTHFNPFVHRMTVSVFEGCPVDARLVLAAGVLIVAVEGRQQN